MSGVRLQRYVIRDANSGDFISEHRDHSAARRALAKVARIAGRHEHRQMPQGESAPRTFVLYQRVVGTEYPMMRVSTRTILCPHVERFGLPPPRERPVKVVDGDGTVRPASNAELRAMEERDGARPAPVTHAHWYQVAARELDERWGR